MGKMKKGTCMSTAEIYQLLFNEKKGSYLLMIVRKHQTTLVRSTTLSEKSENGKTSVAKKKEIKKKLVFNFLLIKKQKTVKQQL